MGGISTRHKAAIALVAVLAMGVPQTVFAACAMPKERAALEARVLQSELMIAALSCNQRPSYNAVVTKYKGEMATTGKSLKQYFSRVYGGQSSAELNGFVTRMANEASQRSLAELDAFCGSAAQKFAHLMESKAKSFEEFAAVQPTAAAHGVAVCQYTAAKTR
ncbi:hypothetical protein [Oceanibaculum pacificum]|uniref:Uncharacterized protein n=1 Tax=Oceanibaculum pacificum TaxID=580166 RepID=A0A154WGQ7_9PROT|nr:hypothetical protein [Oceanibaculum pacificum]KZD12714.1 hypothetical protein AUP43_15375 [Oceanibaculum pacificum]